MNSNEKRLKLEMSRMSERRRAALVEGVAYFLKTKITPSQLMYFLSDRFYWLCYINGKEPDPKTIEALWGLKVLMDRVAIPWKEGGNAEEGLVYAFFRVCGEIGADGLRECLSHVFKAYGSECCRDGFISVKGMNSDVPSFCALSNLCVCLEEYESILGDEKGV